MTWTGGDSAAVSEILLAVDMAKGSTAFGVRHSTNK